MLTFYFGIDNHAQTVTGASHSAGGAATVADPRISDGPRGPHFNNVYRIVPWDAASPTLSSGNAPSAGGLAVSDPRVTRAPADDYVTAGHYGVLPWTDTCGAIAAAACHDNGRWSVADPRIVALPDATTKLVAAIRALDGTWHRPFTTLELDALQSLVDPDELIDFHGNSDSAKRERIGKRSSTKCGSGDRRHDGRDAPAGNVRRTVHAIVATDLGPSSRSGIERRKRTLATCRRMNMAAAHGVAWHK